MDLKKEAARAASALIKNNSAVGLGDGTTIRFLAGFLLEDIRNGLNVRLYTSSLATEKFISGAGVNVFDISSTGKLDQYFDGCDQVDQQLNVIKSGAGIHTQEKLLASMADQFIILADGSKFSSVPDPKLPLVLEILPQAANFVRKEMQLIFPDAGFSIRKDHDDENIPERTRNGNYLMDCWFPEWPDAGFIHSQTKQITGVIETSLFYRMVHDALIAWNSGVARYQRKNNQVLKIAENPPEGI